MLWFKFVFGWTIFELVSVLFAILPDYGNEYMIKEIKNELVLKFCTQNNSNLICGLVNIQPLVTLISEDNNNC